MLKLLQTIDKSNALRRKRSKATTLLQFRELYGNMLSFNEGKCSFQQEYQKLQASQPTVFIFNIYNLLIIVLLLVIQSATSSHRH